MLNLPGFNLELEGILASLGVALPAEANNEMVFLPCRVTD